MCDNKTLDISATSNGVNYYVICNNTQHERPFGILASMDNDRTDANSVENLFFTKEEALKCCEWLAENNVFPITLCEVLADLYYV